jgi:hypothetical protein
MGTDSGGQKHTRQSAMCTSRELGSGRLGVELDQAAFRDLSDLLS